MRYPAKLRRNELSAMVYFPQIPWSAWLSVIPILDSHYGVWSFFAH